MVRSIKVRPINVRPIKVRSSKVRSIKVRSTDVRPIVWGLYCFSCRCMISVCICLWFFVYFIIVMHICNSVNPVLHTLTQHIYNIYIYIY